MRASLRRKAADGLRSDFAAANLQAGVYVERILKGERLSDRSVVLSAKFGLVINLKTAAQPAFALEQLEHLEWRGRRRGNLRSLPAMRTKLDPHIPDPVTVISIRKKYRRIAGISSLERKSGYQVTRVRYYQGRRDTTGPEIRAIGSKLRAAFIQFGRMRVATDRRIRPALVSTRSSTVVRCVKVCGCRPHEGGAAHAEGRRTQTSNGGNRGRCGEMARQTLWGLPLT